MHGHTQARERLLLRDLRLEKTLPHLGRLHRRLGAAEPLVHAISESHGWILPLGRERQNRDMPASAGQCEGRRSPGALRMHTWIARSYDSPR